MGTIFFAPLGGLFAANTRASVAANNIANVNTPGYHASRAYSMDLSPLGTALQTIQRDGRSGVFFATGSPTDLAVSGDAFFAVRTPDGGMAYTRAGSFRPDREGYLVGAGGERIEPPVQIPAGAQGVFVSRDGRVTAIVDGEPREVGRVQVARFNNSGGLRAVGANLFVETGASGPPSIGHPGEGAYPMLFAGYLESSNVDLATEFIDLTMAKAAVAANVEVIRAADEISAASLTIKR